MKKRNPYLTAGLVMTGILTALIVMGVFWTPYDPNAMAAGPKLAGPSLAPGHPRPYQYPVPDLPE